jgi:hypothetical protein
MIFILYMGCRMRKRNIHGIFLPHDLCSLLELDFMVEKNLFCLQTLFYSLAICSSFLLNYSFSQDYNFQKVMGASLN